MDPEADPEGQKHADPTDPEHWKEDKQQYGTGTYKRENTDASFPAYSSREGRSTVADPNHFNADPAFSMKCGPGRKQSISNN